MTTRVQRRVRGVGPGVVLGIDQSYSGFAVVALTRGAAPTVVPVGKFESKRYGIGVDRLGAVEDWLVGVLAVTAPVSHVCMEGYANARMNGREMAGELGYCVKRALRQQLGDPVGYPTIVPPSSLKKWVTGRGNAKKDEMLKAVFQRWGFDTNNDNVADAYGLARMAHALAWGSHDLPKFQVEVLGNLTEHTERAHGAGVSGDSDGRPG